MLVAARLTNKGQLELLLLIFHFFLALEENFGHNGHRLLHSHIAELDLLNLIASHLLTTTRGAAIVLEAVTRRLNHVQAEALDGVVLSKDERRANRSVGRRESAQLELLSHAVGEHVARDLDMELALVLGGFFARSLNDRATVGRHAVDDTAAVHGDRIKSLVSARDHHLVEHELLRTENDAVLADNTEDSAGGRQPSQRTLPDRCDPQARDYNSRSQTIEEKNYAGQYASCLLMGIERFTYSGATHY